MKAKKFKSGLSLLLSLVMLFSITAGIDLSAYAKTSGDFEYELLDDGTVQITNYIGESSEVVIPSNIEGRLVTNLANYSFYDGRAVYATEITSISIPYSVTHIYCAFVGCEHLETIEVDSDNKYFCTFDGVLFNKDMTELIHYPSGDKRTIYEIPNGVIEITGYGAFQDAVNLIEVIISDTVSEIDDYTFMGCTNLKNINLPWKVTDINSGTFQDCVSLNSLILPDNLRWIDWRAFAGSGLNSIFIPKKVNYIGDYAFNECKNLIDIDVSQENEFYSSSDGVLFNKDKTELIQYPIGNTRTSYTIPDSVTNIGNQAFEYCENLTRVTISDSVTNIDRYAFWDCIALKDIIMSANIASIGISAFSNTAYENDVSNYENGLLYIGSALIDFDRSLMDIDNLKSYVIKDGTTLVSDFAFWCCTWYTELENIILPESIMYIGEGAFADCDELKNIIVLNKNSNIYDIEEEQGERTFSSNSVIYGFRESTAQAYAEKYYRDFIALDDYDCACGKHCEFYSYSKEETCIENGFTEYICVLCGTTHREEISAHHNSINGFCSLCGAKDPDCVLPSINLNETKTVNIENKDETFYYQFTPSQTEQYTFYSSGEYDTYGYLYDEEMNLLFDDDDGGESFNFSVTYDLQADKTYIYACRMYSPDSTGTFNVTLDFAEQEHQHNYVLTVTQPTCTKQGYTTYTCSCGDSYIDNYVEATGHTYKATTTKATTSKNGSIVTKCSVCGDVKSKTTIYYPKTITLSSTSYTYDGKVKKPSVTVKDSKGNKIASSNYTVSYSSGRKNVGKYTVTIKFKGNYSGTVKKTFTIKPKNTSISKISAKSKGFTVKWKKYTTQTTGYQIQYSTSSKFSNAKTVTVSKNSTTSKTISKLKAKKKYYVRIRTYKTVSGTKYYSSWSKAKTVTTKK